MGEVRIRWAEVDDAHAVAVVHVDTWRAAYQGLIADEVLDGLSVEQREVGWSSRIAASLAVEATNGALRPSHRMLVAEADSTVVGWATFGAGRDDGTSQRGELSGLYVHPEYWSRKVGHELLVRLEDELRAAGFAEAYLWVLASNERAIRFYEQHGWHADGGEKVGSAGGADDLHELRHVRHLASGA